MSRTAESLLAIVVVGIAIGAMLSGKTINIQTEPVVPEPTNKPASSANFDEWWNYLISRYGRPTATDFSLDLDPKENLVKCFIYRNNRVVVFNFDSKIILVTCDRKGTQTVTSGMFTSRSYSESFNNSTNPILDILNYYGRVNDV